MEPKAVKKWHKSVLLSVKLTPPFAKVLDGRKQPIRGLWVRNGRYYARLTVEDPITGLKKMSGVPPRIQTATRLRLCPGGRRD